MDKFLNTYKEIQKSSRNKSIKVISMTIIVVTLIISFSVTTLKMFDKAQKNTRILDYDGRERKHEYIHPDSANVIRCQAFMDEFTFYFFVHNDNPKDIERKLIFAMNLGKDKSLKQAYRWFLNKNWYSDLIANNIEQTIKIVKNEPVLRDNYFEVYFEGIVTLREIGGGTGQALNYRLTFTCDAVPHKQSYPQYKQGLKIENFRFNFKEL